MSEPKCGCSVTQGAVHCMHGNLIEAAPSAYDDRENPFEPHSWGFGIWNDARKGMVPAAEAAKKEFENARLRQLLRTSVGLFCGRLSEEERLIRDIESILNPSEEGKE